MKRTKFVDEIRVSNIKKPKFVDEFKAFAIKGNVIDMAVGIVIGAAFGKIVSSLVGDVIMPALGVLIGGMDFSSFGITLKNAVVDSSGVTITPAVILYYGKFIQAFVDFLIIAATLFFLIKGINQLKRKEEAKPSVPTPPSKEVELLGEIRDLLKKDNPDQSR